MSIGLLAACAASAAEPPTSVENGAVESAVTPTCACGRVVVRQFVPSSPGGTTRLSPTPWVSGARNMSVVMTSYSDPTRGTTILAWGVGDGKQVGWLYSVSARDRGAFLDQVNRTFESMDTPGSNVSWVIAGGFIIGPGNPPEPGGEPELALVQRVLRTAGSYQDTTDATLGFEPDPRL